MKIRIRRLDPAVALPAYHSSGAAAFDLAAAQDAIVARSSLPVRKGLIVANGVGIVDADYCGPDDEVKVEVLNVTRAPVEVRRGERIAQGLVLGVARVEWDEVAEASTPSRGGFGATGGYA